MEASFDTLLADDNRSAAPIAIQPFYGGAERPVHQMSQADLLALSEAVMVTVREAAFSRGLPVVCERGGQTIRQYADGHSEPVG